MKTKIWIALLALYIVWGSTYLAIRFSVETIPPFLHASIRFLISGVILFTWRRLAGDAPPTWSNWKSTAIVGTALLLGGNGLVALAPIKTCAAQARTPIWAGACTGTCLAGLRPASNASRRGWQALFHTVLANNSGAGARSQGAFATE